MGACQKEAANTTPEANSSLSRNDEQLVSEQALIESESLQELDAIFASDAANGSCRPVRTYNPSPDSYPRSVTTDWGTGCENSAGILRTGKIILKYTAPLTVLGGSVVTRYENYSINGVSLEGEWRIENIGVGANGKNLYKLVYNNFKRTQPNGNFIVIEGIRKLQLLSGSITSDFSKGAAYRVTGTLNYTRQRGSVLEQFSSVITKTLAHPAGCKWFSSGVYQNVYPDQSFVTYDYGKGGCDNQATATGKNGVVHNITLP